MKNNRYGNSISMYSDNKYYNHIWNNNNIKKPTLNC